jgi:hypothetical protein
MDKMIRDGRGETLITNDGATILQKLDVVHPTAKMVFLASRSLLRSLRLKTLRLEMELPLSLCSLERFLKLRNLFLTEGSILTSFLKVNDPVTKAFKEHLTLHLKSSRKLFPFPCRFQIEQPSSNVSPPLSALK